MKTKSIIIALILILAIPAQSKHYPMPPPSMRWIRTIPIVLEPLEATVAGGLWLAMAGIGVLVDVLEEMTEPLENYKARIKHVTGATSATMSYVDGEYPTRDLDAERVYDFDPHTDTETWWIKSTFAVFNPDGTITTTTTYSQEPPLLRDFKNEDVHYNRIGMSGNHETSFSYDAFEQVTCCCWRVGFKAWGRPVVITFQGNHFDATFRNDIKYEVPTTLYEDNHYAMIGPGGMVQYKPKNDGNAQIYKMGVATMLPTP